MFLAIKEIVFDKGFEKKIYKIQKKINKKRKM